MSYMHVFPRWAPALLAALPFVVVAPAHAEKLTLGSDLSGAATQTEAQGADTAFWTTTIRGGGVDIPADGQVLSIQVKGSALTEKGAPNGPANMVHFQSLDPATANGARTVYLTSGFFDMPVDNPGAVTTFTPENLCVRQGGAVAFNTIGGFGWAGGDPFNPNPIQNPPSFYKQGTPWQIFSASSTSSTAWFSKDSGTKNGNTLTPAGGTDALGGYGGQLQGKELLMQVIVGTGDDRSESCGGPRRHPDGTLVQTGPDPSYMKVVSSGGKPQQPYVTKDRKFTTGVYCGGEANPYCSGTATMLIGKRIIAKALFNVPAMKTGKVPMRLSAKDFKTLDKSRTKKLKVTYVLTTAFGVYTSTLTLKR
ncbi:MAG: hypothetical protein ACJ762_05210 [Solirubrobacteraceae bacterium]